MSRFFRIDEANAVLPELREVLTLLGEQRSELVRLRDQLLVVAGADPGRGPNPTDEPAPDEPEEARLLRLRIRALVDQMGASVNRIDEWGITLRDIATGLVDFPALVAGRQVWLCWRLGEDQVEWWHELETGIAGRQRIADLRPLGDG